MLFPSYPFFWSSNSYLYIYIYISTIYAPHPLGHIWGDTWLVWEQESYVLMLEAYPVSTSPLFPLEISLFSLNTISRNWAQRSNQACWLIPVISELGKLEAEEPLVWGQPEIHGKTLLVLPALPLPLWDRVTLYSAAWLTWNSLRRPDQVGLELTEICLPLPLKFCD